MIRAFTLLLAVLLVAMLAASCGDATVSPDKTVDRLTADCPGGGGGGHGKGPHGDSDGPPCKDPEDPGDCDRDRIRSHDCKDEDFTPPGEMHRHEGEGPRKGGDDECPGRDNLYELSGAIVERTETTLTVGETLFLIDEDTVWCIDGDMEADPALFIAGVDVEVKARYEGDDLLAFRVRMITDDEDDGGGGGLD